MKNDNKTLAKAVRIIAEEMAQRGGVFQQSALLEAADRIDELKAEVERLRTERDQALASQEAAIKSWTTCSNERNQLKAEVEQLRAFIADLPRITAGMKLDCMGQFSWREEAPYYDESGNVIEHTATHTVPWDICKDIYKSMVQAKLRQQIKEVPNANADRS